MTTATNSVTKYLKKSERRGRVTGRCSDSKVAAPILDVPPSFDHLVGAEQDRGSVQFNAKRSGGFEIHGQFKLCRLHNREIRKNFDAQESDRVGGEAKIECALVVDIAH